MKRVYEHIVAEHLARDEQMLFLAGPRQVGKTTISKKISVPEQSLIYLNWDVIEHRKQITPGPETLGETLNIGKMPRSQKPILVFDEIHKYKDWKIFLKGFYDLYHQHVRIIVTGSAKLDIYTRGGDSLMGRYFLYRIHPLSVGEICQPAVGDDTLRNSSPIEDNDFQALLDFGGFPAPFLKKDQAFYLRWKNLRNKQLFREDIRELTQLHEIDRLEMLAELIRYQCGQLLVRKNLANKVGVSISSINRWIDVLKQVYFCFSVTPWHKNVARSLIKEPKLYCWDWSLIDDAGMKAENFIASHLKKSVDLWNDCGLGEYQLHYLRTKDKQEVDFIVIKNGEPFFLVEVKCSDAKKLSPNLEKFQRQLGAKHAFQVVINLDYQAINCFDYSHPIIVPAKTLLSQLL